MVGVALKQALFSFTSSHSSFLLLYSSPNKTLASLWQLLHDADHVRDEPGPISFEHGGPAVQSEPVLYRLGRDLQRCPRPLPQGSWPQTRTDPPKYSLAPGLKLSGFSPELRKVRTEKPQQRVPETRDYKRGAKVVVNPVKCERSSGVKAGSGSGAGSELWKCFWSRALFSSEQQRRKTRLLSQKTRLFLSVSSLNSDYSRLSRT